MSGGPRTTREALIAEMLGDLDGLLSRIEALPGQVAAAEEQMAATVAILDGAGDKFRLAATAFSDQAKADLAEYLDRKAQEVVARTMEEQRATMEEAARVAFQTKAAGEVISLSVALRKSIDKMRRPLITRFIEHGATAILASGLTVSLLFIIGRLH